MFHVVHGSFDSLNHIVHDSIFGSRRDAIMVCTHGYLLLEFDQVLVVLLELRFSHQFLDYPLGEQFPVCLEVPIGVSEDYFVVRRTGEVSRPIKAIFPVGEEIEVLSLPLGSFFDHLLKVPRGTRELHINPSTRLVLVEVY